MLTEKYADVILHGLGSALIAACPNKIDRTGLGNLIDRTILAVTEAVKPSGAERLTWFFSPFKRGKEGGPLPLQLVVDGEKYEDNHIHAAVWITVNGEVVSTFKYIVGFTLGDFPYIADGPIEPIETIAEVIRQGLRENKYGDVYDYFGRGESETSEELYRLIGRRKLPY